MQEVPVPQRFLLSQKNQISVCLCSLKEFPKEVDLAFTDTTAMLYFEANTQRRATIFFVLMLVREHGGEPVLGFDFYSPEVARPAIFKATRR